MVKRAEKKSSKFERGPRKVRKSMLKKLMKYDYRAQFRILGPCYLAVAGFTLIASVCIAMLKYAQSDIAVWCMVSTNTVYGLAIAASAFFSFFNFLFCYYKSFFSKEGYLTLSIPATPEEHVWSKTITGFVANILTLLVIVCSLLLHGLISGWIPAEDFRQLLPSFGRWIAENPFRNVTLVVEILLFFIILLVFSISIYASCICIGQMFAKNRVLMAIVAYLIASAAFQVIGSFLSVGGIFLSLFEFFFRLGPLGTLAVLIVFFFGLDVGGFFIQRNILKNKVNLV